MKKYKYSEITLERIYNKRRSFIKSIGYGLGALSISSIPLINAKVEGNNIVNNLNINIGMAVALDDDNLIVPVIKKSEELNFLGVARSCSDLAQRARENNLKPDEVKDSTFTVTNPGVFGSLFGMGIINQPNCALLSIGSIHKRPVVKETE